MENKKKTIVKLFAPYADERQEMTDQEAEEFAKAWPEMRGELEKLEKNEEQK